MAEHAGEAVGLVPAALRSRDFRLFWGGVVLSGLGSQVTTVAMVWQMYALTNSAWQIGLLGLARAVPQIALALLGGLMADAMERRRLMMGTQIAQLLVPVALAGVTLDTRWRPPPCMSRQRCSPWRAPWRPRRARRWYPLSCPERR